MTDDIVGAFEKLRDSITAHLLLELLEFQIQPPVDRSTIKDVETQANITVPEAVRRFYQSCNGVLLKWRFKPTLPEEIQNVIKSQFESFTTSTTESLFSVAGNIELLSLQDMLLNEEYSVPQLEDDNGTFDFDGKVYSDNEFSRMLRMFDFIDDYYSMAFVVQSGVPNWKLMLLDDYWIHYRSSRVTWIDDYLEFVLATWGLIDARQRLFGEYRGDRKAPVKFDSGKVSDLMPQVLRDYKGNVR